MPIRNTTAGFTLIELMIVIVMLGIMLAIGLQGFRQYNESTTVDRAVNSIMADVTLTRSYAVQRRRNVSLVADEADRTYAIRDESSGDTLVVRSFSATSDLPLTLLDVQTGDDEVTFNSRGLLAGGLSGVDIDVGRLDRERRIQINAMGRTKMTAVP